MWLPAIALFVLIVASRAPVRAAEVVCPLNVEITNSMDPSTKQLNAIVWSDSKQTVSGKVYFETDSGWYVTTEISPRLEPSVLQLKGGSVVNDHAAYRASLLPIRFSETAAVDAIVFAPTGQKACAAEISGKQSMIERSWSGLPPHNAPDPVYVSATKAPGDTNCEQPFKRVSISNAKIPRVSDLLMNMLGDAKLRTMVGVAVRRDGSIEKTWLFSGSGNVWWDDAVLDAARDSTYAPGRSFCKPSGGVYLFTGDTNS